MESLYAQRMALVDLARTSGGAKLPTRDWGCAASDASTISCPLANRSVHWYSVERQDRWLASNFFCDTCKHHQGTFVEIGAGDGIGASNTKMLEDQFGFKGVLIEGQPSHARKAIASRGGRNGNVVFPEAVCRTPGAVTYAGPADRGTAGVLDEMSANYLKYFGHRMTHNYTVPCRPISAMLELAGVRSIDLFSLDVEGGELLVLQTFDWSIPVRLWIVELDGSNPTREDAIRELLATRGYAPWIPHGTSAGAGRLDFRIGKFPCGDEAFVHHSLVDGLPGRRAQCARCMGGP